MVIVFLGAFSFVSLPPPSVYVPWRFLKSTGINSPATPLCAAPVLSLLNSPKLGEYNFHAQ